MLFFAMFFILARLDRVSVLSKDSVFQPFSSYLFWNQICTERSVMLISWAIRSRVAAVGVGFLLNSSSKVTSWSCVARWRFWFFCCCVRVLFRGGRRGAELWVGVEMEAVGEAMVVSSGDCMVVVMVVVVLGGVLSDSKVKGDRVVDWELS